LLTQDGEVKPIGSKVQLLDLARTLEVIAQRGAEGFYQGSVAEEIASATQAAGGVITVADLKNYQPKEREVLKGTYQGYTLMAMPPPSSGGAVIIQALRSLEETLKPLTPQKLGHESHLYLHALTESLKHAFADRARYMGDPDFVKVPLEEMLSSRRISDIVSAFDQHKTHPRASYGGNYLSPPDGGTSHFNVLDVHGNAIALTTTINTGFGSRFVAGSSGVLLNNEMDDFIVKPGVPNAYGLIGREANAVEASKRPLSSMSPTILIRDHRVVGMVGGSGGPTIITGTIQVLLNLIHFDGVNGDVGRAVDAPRLHHQWVPETLMYDQGLSRDSLDGLLARGHELKPWYSRFNAIQALWVKSRGGRDLIFGASDPSKRGKPAAVHEHSIK
jgi:gamma-glutamyltranspeptidase/glutathione hydrolase